MSTTPTPLSWQDPMRESAFTTWFTRLCAQHKLRASSLRAASSDTSFRRYFRVDIEGGSASLVIMDAPPALEDCAGYVRMARLLHDAGLHVPTILDWDEANGFMLLSDLGPTTYLDRMRADPQATDSLCEQASESLVRLQGIPKPQWLPDYDVARIRMELSWFTQWYVSAYFGLPLEGRTGAVLEQASEALERCFLQQPQIMVHRDYHSRNLMVSDPNPGILDFQGAVWGPAAYDLAGMLRDAYIEWDESFQIAHAQAHWERARATGVPMPSSFNDFWRDFEWCGLQRQLKVLGLFARLTLRDGKHDYVADMPRVWGYAVRTAQRYEELAPLADLLLRLDPASHASAREASSATASTAPR